MMKMKKMMALLLALVMVLALTACGGGEAEDGGVPVYEVLTEATYPPFDTVDEDGNIVGFDMDLIAAIGEDQGFKVEFVDMAFTALIPALEAGNGDIITMKFAGITVGGTADPVKSVAIASTMGPGIKLNTAKLS